MLVAQSCEPWSVARQAPLSMGFSRQVYWSGLPCPSPGDLPDPGIEPAPALQADSLPSKPGQVCIFHSICQGTWRWEVARRLADTDLIRSVF